MLILGTFVFVMEVEDRVSAFAKKELSKWASMLPVKPEPEIKSLNPYDHDISLIQVILIDSADNKVRPVHN